MKIAFVDTAGLLNMRGWTGVVEAMPRFIPGPSDTIEHLDPGPERLSVLFKAWQKIHNRLLPTRYQRQRQPYILHGYGRRLEQQIARSRPDVVLSASSLPIAQLRTECPIVLWTDATFAAMVDFYPGFQRLSPATLKNGHAMERAAIQNTRMAIYTSRWAAQSAIEYYGADPKRVRVAPYGSGLDELADENDAIQLIETRSREVCRLLFLAMEWERKGGDVALAIAAGLHQAGFPVELTIAGASPNLDLPGWVRAVGVIGRERIIAELGRTHFLLLPTRADCTPNVFCEASAMAVPSVSTNVGGISSLIRDEVNGRMFSRDSPLAEYQDWIRTCFSDADRYRTLALNSFREYQQKLNWRLSGATVRGFLEEVARPLIPPILEESESKHHFRG